MLNMRVVIGLHSTPITWYAPMAMCRSPMAPGLCAHFITVSVALILTVKSAPHTSGILRSNQWQHKQQSVVTVQTRKQGHLTQSQSVPIHLALQQQIPALPLVVAREAREALVAARVTTKHAGS